MRRLLPIALLLVGCVGTSVPQPPNLMPVDPELVMAPTQEAAGPLELGGLPGAAEPGAELYVWDLGAATPPTVGRVELDGSFFVLVPAPSGALRLQVRDGDERSLPVDLSPGPAASMALARRACLSVERELLLEERGAASLEIINDCEAEAELGSARLRVGTDFSLDAPPGLTVLPGTRAELVVEALGDGGEDIVLLELSVDRTTYLYPITVSASAR